MNAVSFKYNLELLQQRDQVAFSRLYKEYKDKIFSFLIIKANGNINIAEEVLCDTFHSAIESAPKLKTNSNIKSWLFKIASRRLADYFRKLYKDNNFYDVYDDMEPFYSNYHITNDVFTKQEETYLVNFAFNKLKDSYRDIIRLKYIENKSLKEISNITNKNHSTINSLLQRARVVLKKEFKKTINKF